MKRRLKIGMKNVILKYVFGALLSLMCRSCVLESADFASILSNFNSLLLNEVRSYLAPVFPSLSVFPRVSSTHIVCII